MRLGTVPAEFIGPVQKGLPGGATELWQVPLSGTPRKLDIDATRWSSFHVSADGKQIAFVSQAGESGNQVWALENLLPKN